MEISLLPGHLVPSVRMLTTSSRGAVGTVVGGVDACPRLRPGRSGHIDTVYRVLPVNRDPHVAVATVPVACLAARIVITLGHQGNQASTGGPAGTNATTPPGHMSPLRAQRRDRWRRRTRLR